MENIDEMINRLSSRFKLVRKIKGLTLVELSEVAGFSHSFLSQVENAKRGFGLKMVMSLCKVLDISIEKLLYSDDEEFHAHVGYTEHLKVKVQKAEEIKCLQDRLKELKK